jgi:hypothetical protein
MYYETNGVLLDEERKMSSHQFDEVAPLRSGESEIEPRRSSFARIKAQIADKLHQAAETLQRRLQIAINKYFNGVSGFESK